MDYKHIAAKLKLPLGTVQFSIAEIYKRHHVHKRQDLRDLLSPPPPSATPAG